MTNQTPLLPDSSIEESYKELSSYRLIAVQTLHEVMTTGKPSDQLNAANAVLNRTGLPEKPQTPQDPNSTPSISPDTLRTIFTGIAQMFQIVPNHVASQREAQSDLKNVTPQNPKTLAQQKPSTLAPQEQAGQAEQAQQAEQTEQEQERTADQQTAAQPEKPPKTITSATQKTPSNELSNELSDESEQPKEQETNVPAEVLDSLSGESGDYI